MSPKPQTTRHIRQQDIDRAMRLAIRDQQNMLKKARQIAKEQGLKVDF